MEDLLAQFGSGENAVGFTIPARKPAPGEKSSIPDECVAAAIYGTKLELTTAKGQLDEGGDLIEDGFVEMEKWLRNNHELLTLPNAYIGGWKDPQNGIYELNVSLVFENLVDGYKFGVRNDQKFIYDFDSGELINTGGANEQAKEERLAKSKAKAARNRKGHQSP